MSLKTEIEKLQSDITEEIIASVNIPIKDREQSPTAVAIKGVKSYFPTFKKPGRLIIPLDIAEMHYLSAYKTTEAHDKAALGVMKIISDMYSTRMAIEVRESQGEITVEDMEQYTEINFDIGNFTRTINGRGGEYLELRTAKLLMELASVTLYVVRTSPLDVMPLQWFRSFVVKKGHSRLLVNRLIIKQMLATPLKYNFGWLFSLKDKGFRAGLLIEEKKFGKSKYADSIMEDVVLAAIRPQKDSRTGRPRIKEVEKAFKDAHAAGYPLYKRGRNNDGELCWVNTTGKRNDYISQLNRHKKPCKTHV